MSLIQCSHQGNIFETVMTKKPPTIKKHIVPMSIKKPIPGINCCHHEEKQISTATHKESFNSNERFKSKLFIPENKNAKKRMFLQTKRTSVHER
jgi:hypothetical protein